MIVGCVFQACHLDPIREKRVSQILGRGPRFLLPWPLWLAIAVIAELALMPYGVTPPIPALFHNTTHVIWVAAVADPVLDDNANRQHSAPTLASCLIIHRLGQTLLLICCGSRGD
tara:strand:- start:652 stop:996 length:345 start_codon:yes stop_codon:yes gene_type:complete